MHSFGKIILCRAIEPIPETSTVYAYTRVYCDHSLLISRHNTVIMKKEVCTLMYNSFEQIVLNVLYIVINMSAPFN